MSQSQNRWFIHHAPMSEWWCGQSYLCPICDYFFNSLTRKQDFSCQRFMLALRSCLHFHFLFRLLWILSLKLFISDDSFLIKLCSLALPWRLRALILWVPSPNPWFYPGALRLCVALRAALKKKRQTKIISCSLKGGRRERELGYPTSLSWGWESNYVLVMYIEHTG